MNKKKSTILQKLTMSYFLLVIALLLIMCIFILPAQLQNYNTSLEDNISWTAYLLSCDSQVIAEMSEGSISDALNKRLTNITTQSSQFDYIVLANTKSIRLYHPDNTEIGKSFVGGDEQRILSNSLPYISTEQGRTDRQKRAFHQVTDSDGNLLGFVMVSASLSTVRSEQLHLIGKFILIFGFLLLFGITFAYFTARNLRHSLLGYEPDTFTKMFLQREEILDNLNEGIVAINRTGLNRYVNPSAKKLLGDQLELINTSELSHLIKECIDTKQSRIGLPFECNDNSLLLSLMPLFEDENVVGVLIILRNRTTTIRLAEQLTGTTHILDALRATTHEYLNKLHIISGMLQIGEYEEAITFIDGLSNETKNGYQTVIRQIQNKTIAALLLGKQSHAKELDINFTLQKDSYLKPHNTFLSTQELVTIVGNLIENAFYAVEKKTDLRQVQLFIGMTMEGLTIVVDDTGCGMTNEQIEKIYQGHFTTRGEGHGIGLSLIQEIIRKHEGYLDIDSEPGTGSSFTISFKRKENSHD